MVEKKNNFVSTIFTEFCDVEKCHWFDIKQKKFLHNVDTFYYSVKFKNDFRQVTNDERVKRMRKFFTLKYSELQRYAESDFYVPDLGENLVLRPVTFSRFYNTCLSYPEYFDIFLATTVPKAPDGGESVTCECIVQLRSYFLWQLGVRDAFENSYRYVQSIADFFGLEIDFVQENRVDYCWHTNYLKDPESFFEPKTFYKMRVDRFKNATYVTNKVGSNDYEIDYVALGKRSDKVFIRIYQKTREVIEQNYKPWFFLVWKMNGLINEYDKYVYEKAFAKRSWFYRFYARLEFYAEYGRDPEHVQRCKDILEGSLKIEENALIAYADKLTPKLNYVINVEYQTMRRHSKSYDLVPFKDHRNKGETKRIYDYFDNRKIIIDYLTNKVFRLVTLEGEKNKAKRPLCPFWEALRRTRCLDMKMTSDNVKLLRIYNSKLSKNAIKQRAINAMVTYSLYTHGENDNTLFQDAFEFMLRMNDNDLHKARQIKQKRLRQLNPEELAEVYETDKVHDFTFLDNETGTLYDYNSILETDWQEENENDDS